MATKSDGDTLGVIANASNADLNRIQSTTTHRRVPLIFKALAIFAFSTLASAQDAGLNATCTNEKGHDKLVPAKEIEYVKILNADISSPPWTRPDELFVEFFHRGAYRGKSLPLGSLGHRKVDLHEPSYVNLPILATDEAMQEPIRCTIKRGHHFFPDEILYTAEVILQDGDTVTGVVRDLEGQDTGTRIELSVFDDEWVGSVEEAGLPPEDTDLYYTVFSKAVQSLYLLFFPGEGGGTNVSLQKPVKAADPNLAVNTVLDGMVEFPTTDEFIPPIWQIDFALPLANKLLSHTEKNSPVGDRATLINQLRVNTLKHVMTAPNEGRWLAPYSDNSMHRLFFYASGLMKTRKVRADDEYANTNEYVVDFTFMSDLKYRPGFENLGCKVYFDSDANITLIEDNDGSVYRPREEYWEWAKLKARSASFIEVALIHLVQYHLVWGNAPGMALRKFLEPDHKVRIALTPHFFKTARTSTLAEHSLLAEYSPLGRVFPLEYKGGFETSLKRKLTSFEFKTWPEELEEKGMLGDEYHIGATDAVDLHKILTDYASNLFDEIYPNEETLQKDGDMRTTYSFLIEKMGVPSEFTLHNVKMVFGEILFRVTGIHTLVGNSAISGMEPFFSNHRMKTNEKGSVHGTREAIKTTTTISALTIYAGDPTLADDWSAVLPDSNSTAYARLRDNLTKLGEDIDERNQRRRFVTMDFHPDITGISISS